MKKKMMGLALALVMCMSLCIPAFAQTRTADVEYDSSSKDVSYYSVYSALYVGIEPCWRAGTWIRADRTVSANQMGANSRLYYGDGSLRIDTGFVFNSSSDYFTFSTTPYVYGAGSYYSWGQVRVWNGYQWVTDNCEKTQTIGRSNTMAALLDTLNENGGYPVNERGETYGSAMLSDVVGCEPELIDAVGTDGIRGYVRADDLDPHVYTPEDAAAYMAAFNDNRELPLYDLSGNVIGTFELQVAATSNDSAFADMDMDAARAAVANNVI